MRNSEISSTEATNCAASNLARRLRRDVVQLVAATGQGYVQQGLGAADLFAVLYGEVLRYRIGEPLWSERDRFLLSTAHNSAIFGAALHHSGLMSREMLESYCTDGSPYEINMSERLGPIVEATCGSLGQGLSVAIGMALSGRRRGQGYRCYVMLGDGELQEGQVWEAIMAAGHYRLSNLCMVIDWNEMQVEGHCETVMNMNPIAKKLEAFNWRVLDIDGHDISQVREAFRTAESTVDQPTAVIARTLVGKGAPCLEGRLGHNLKLPLETAEQALRELAQTDSTEEASS